MEVVLEGFKLWGPFAVFCVAVMAFSWRVNNRRDDKLEAFFTRGISDLRKEMNSQNELLRKETDSQIANLKVSIKQLEVSIKRLEAQMLAYSESHQADIEALVQKIDSNTQELRTEIRQLNQSHIRHLEHHIELDRRAEKK